MVDDKTDGEHAIKLSAGEGDKKGVYLGQSISNSFAGYKFKYSIDAKRVTTSSVGNLEIDYFSGAGKLLKRENIPVDSLTFKTLEGNITMPIDSKLLKIYITCEDGEIIYDNAVLNRVID